MFGNNGSGQEEPLWVYPKDDPELKEAIIKEYRLHPVTAQILVSRGFTDLEDIHNYLYAKLPDLHDPFLLGGMDAAVKRICEALDHEEGILIYGDNDVDGMTGAALLTDFLRKIGGKAFFYISNRTILRESLFVDALDYADQHQCKLMITVDCGITAAVEIAKVIEKNIDVIITDHHEPTDRIPNCVATLNPKLVGISYPNRDLTGVGVAFKLIHAITNVRVAQGKVQSDEVDLKRYLDLVALGTVSDMGSLLGENRILVRYGLRQLKRCKRVGLAKLMEVCEVQPTEITTFDIASKIAPRLNSLGRIDDPQKGVELLLLTDSNDAEALAKELDLNNIERQRIERTMSTDVEQSLLTDKEILSRKAIVMSSDKWHPGIIAIVCARICKTYNRPTAMIAIEGKIGKGSLRSIREFPLLNTLKENAELLLNFGGHDFAAGLTIEAHNVEEFKKRFIAAVEKTLTPEDIISKLYIDSPVSFEDLTFDFMEVIKLLEPFGNENSPPVLYCDAQQAWPPKVIGKTHLRMYLQQGDRILEGVAFNKADQFKALRRKNLTLRVAFTPQINIFQNKASIQLLIRDFQVMEEPKKD
ncbi:MAG: single-stranded-DNA-specific exonuclease RecJ [Chlamydiales bacterium]|nr:single-stranded-DNA-specific exonuclease RecJ [Chlamydiales bacterium]